MSEEKMNNNEETSALFVSAQKKKQAEEEARRKAEEEQAKREAAEAEVRRMEQEVEERKREAAEKKAAEAGALTAADQTKAQNKDKSKPDGKSNVKKYIAIAAAAVVVLFIIIGIAGSNNGPDVDYDNLVFDKEYMSTKDGYDVVIRYPGSLYSEVTEEMTENMLNITFHSEIKGVPAMYSTIYNTDSSLVSLQRSPVDTANMVNSFFAQSKELMSEEHVCDLSDENTVRYEYHGYGRDGEEDFAAGDWLVSGRSEKILLLAARTVGKADDTDAERKLMDAFYNENSTDIVKVAGNYPIDDVNYDGYITYEPLSIKIPVPKDRFVQLDDEGHMWADKNGAVIYLASQLDGGPIESVPYDDQEWVDEQIDFYSDMAKEGLTELISLDGIESRTFISEELKPATEYDVFDEFTTVRNGFKYWERDYQTFWVSPDRQGCVFCMITYVPDKSTNDYKNIFSESIKKIETM